MLIGFGLVASIALLAVLAFSFYYDLYCHPLARLAQSIEIGSDCDVLRDEFAEYASSPSHMKALFSEPVYSENFHHTEEVPPESGLFIYELTTMDDLQLSVRCSAGRRVVEVDYLGD